MFYFKANKERLCLHIKSVDLFFYTPLIPLTSFYFSVRRRRRQSNPGHESFFSCLCSSCYRYHTMSVSGAFFFFYIYRLNMYLSRWKIFSTSRSSVLSSLFVSSFDRSRVIINELYKICTFVWLVTSLLSNYSTFTITILLSRLIFQLSIQFSKIYCFLLQSFLRDIMFR